MYCLATNPYLDLGNGIGSVKANAELKTQNDELQEIPKHILDFARRLQEVVRSGQMKGIGATSILQKFKTLHEESKIGVPQKVSVLPELCHAKEDNAWLNEEGNLLARVLLILIDEGHDVPIAGIMEVLTRMLKFEPQDVPNWYLGLLYNKEHLAELQCIFKNVWNRSKRDKTFDETFKSSATWIFYWMRMRALGDKKPHQMKIQEEIRDKIAVHWCPKLK